MGRDEQQEEREVLDSIYPDEIQDISSTEYRITVDLEVTNESGDETPAPTILLNVRYPDAYPDVAPDLDITAPPNAARHPFFDVQADKAALLSALQPAIEENLGMAMVFTLVTTLKEAAEQLIAERQGEVQAQREAELLKAEEEENRKFEGAKVTKESFLAWQEAFKAEMMEEKTRRAAELETEERKKRGKVEEKKLTGKQLWEQGLAGKTVEEDEDDGDDVVDVQKLSLQQPVSAA